MTRILIVLEAGDRWPSGVVRGLVYRDLLLKHGYAATFVSRQPLWIMDFIDNLPSLMRRIFGRPHVRDAIVSPATAASERRIRKAARDVDIVYMSKVLSYPLIRAICKESSAPVVYDFGDSVWLYDNDPNEFNEVLSNVNAVTTDNEVTAEYVRKFNKNCTVIPDPSQIEEFDRRRSEFGRKAETPITIGWIGTPGTTYNLFVVWEALEEIFRRYSHVRLRLVGTGPNLHYCPPFENVRNSYRPFYDQREMIEEVFRMHIGLYPLQNVEKCRVRGLLKATIYMCGEAVVVASPIGRNTDLIEDGVNGLLAGSTQEWIDQLELLINDASLRNRLVENGLETVRSRFRTDQSFEKLDHVFKSFACT